MGREEWNRRYAGSELVWTAQPNRFLVAEAGDLPPGRALDLACGEGRNAVWLAERGWQVTGVDFSDIGAREGARARGRAGSRGRVDAVRPARVRAGAARVRSRDRLLLAGARGGAAAGAASRRGVRSRPAARCCSSRTTAATSSTATAGRRSRPSSTPPPTLSRTSTAAASRSSGPRSSSGRSRPPTASASPSMRLSARGVPERSGPGVEPSQPGAARPDGF